MYTWRQLVAQWMDMAVSWKFLGRRDRGQVQGRGLSDLVSGYSIEVMPRTAKGVESFRELLAAGTRVYVAHIAGTPIEDMVATARRVRDEGFPVMPHIPARLVPDRPTLDDWVRRYAEEAGVDQALVLAGGGQPAGDLHSAMQLLESGVFDRHGFRRLHVAGHPEGNRDIDPDGGERGVSEALRWKADFAERTDATMALVTQFAFEAQPILDWIRRIREAGVTLPVHVGTAGPAKLQTLIKFAAACGVGPSFDVLKKRAKDVRKLLMPFDPAEVLADVAQHRALHPDRSVEQVHFFPLGGIRASAEWANALLAVPAAARA